MSPVFDSSRTICWNSFLQWTLNDEVYQGQGNSFVNNTIFLDSQTFLWNGNNGHHQVFSISRLKTSSKRHPNDTLFQRLYIGVLCEQYYLLGQLDILWNGKVFSIFSLKINYFKKWRSFLTTIGLRWLNFVGQQKSRIKQCWRVPSRLSNFLSQP